MANRKKTNWEKAHVIAVIVAAVIGIIPSFFAGRVTVTIDNDQQLIREFDRGFAAGMASVEIPEVPAVDVYTPLPTTTMVTTTRSPRGEPFLQEVPWFEERAMMTMTVNMQGDTFSNAIVWHTSSWGVDGWSHHNLRGQYSILTGTIGRIDGSGERVGTIRFIGDGRELDYFQIDGSTSPDEISIDVTGVLILRVEIQESFAGSARIAFANARIQ
ncbi:MAG: hypothetical protein FWD06_06555 [Oscillospiraceae bacterium]|nr:hypothetical protein [Oscillospiraceae bacterium]